MFSPTGTGISTGICWKAESRNGPCRGPFLQSFRGKLFQGKSFLTPVKLRIKSVEVFGVKALLNEPEGFTETLEMDNLSCPQEADGVRHIGIPDCSEDVIVGRPGLLFCSHVFRQIGNDISLGLELAGIKRNAPGSLRPERRGMVDIIGTEAGVFDFFHGQVFGELIDDGADHFEMSEFVGTLRLSVIFIQVIIDLVNPDSLLFENVKGFTLAFQGDSVEKPGKRYSEYILSELRRRGYMVEAKMLDFSRFGVPQRRCRFILFASKSIEPTLFFERLSNNIKPFLKKKGIPQTVCIKSALSDLEQRNGQTNCPDSKGFMSGVYGSPRTSYQRYCRCGAHKGKIPDSHRFAKHRPDTVKRFQELLDLNIRDYNISKILKKEYGIKKNCFSVLNASIPAPTLTSNPDDHIHYCEPRTLTVREYARIQTFPDWYLFKGPYTTGGDSRKTDVPRYTQIGNAIPPLFAEQVGIALLQLIQEKINNE